MHNCPGVLAEAVAIYRRLALTMDMSSVRSLASSTLCIGCAVSVVCSPAAAEGPLLIGPCFTKKCCQVADISTVLLIPCQHLQQVQLEQGSLGETGSTMHVLTHN